MSFFKKQKGFTLIELLVVISIIGLLSSVVLASLNSARIKARNTAIQQNVRAYLLAAQQYQLDHNYYPYPHDGSNETLCLGQKDASTGNCVEDTSAEDIESIYSQYIPGFPNPNSIPMDFNATPSQANVYCSNLRDNGNGTYDCLEILFSWYLFGPVGDSCAFGAGQGSDDQGSPNSSCNLTLGQ